MNKVEINLHGLVKKRQPLEVGTKHILYRHPFWGETELHVIEKNTAVLGNKDSIPIQVMDLFGPRDTDKKTSDTSVYSGEALRNIEVPRKFVHILIGRKTVFEPSPEIT
jgi:hypothetical protein